QDLIKKFGQVWKESISTLHSAGFSLVKKELGIRSSYDIDVNGQKYKRIREHPIFAKIAISECSMKTIQH
ncbi:MAG: hypothetical protein ACYTX0_41440, partial [Nostoc sp.]